MSDHRVPEPPPSVHRFVDDYLPALLAQASQLISGEFHQVVHQQGLSISEWRILASLGDGSEISIGELAQITVTKQPTVTRLLDRMASRGQVQRLPHPTDRRSTLVRITPTGARMVERLMALAREHEAQVLAPLGAARAAELKNTLRQMIAAHGGRTAEPLAPADDRTAPVGAF